MIYFIAALYNEEVELKDDFLIHVAYIVNGWRICDDGSTDATGDILEQLKMYGPSDFDYKIIEHTGLPETVKHEAKEMVPDGSWCLMLDADERLTPETVIAIGEWFDSGEYQNWDYVYFNQIEIIDGAHVRSFQKAKLFRKEAVSFPLHNIHADDQFTGRGTYMDKWIVLHRKSSTKQIQREQEYLDTYKKLLDEGSIDQGRYEWLRNLHHFVR